MEEIINKSNQEAAKEILKTIESADSLDKIQDFLKNNIIEWQSEDKQATYRVRKPTYQEKKEIRKIKVDRLTEMLKDEKYLYESKLIELYEQKGVSIAKMIEKMVSIGQLIEEKQLQLAQLGNVKEEESQRVTDLKVEIYNLKVERDSLAIEKADLLSFSIESELLILANTYMTYLVYEKKVEDKWAKVFDKYDDMMNNEDDVNVQTAGYYLGLLIYHNSAE